MTQPIPNPRNVIKQEFLTSVCIPNLAKISHQIERILVLFGIKIYHCSNQKVYQLLYTHKDTTENNLKPSVYRIPCSCEKLCIGETERNLKIRQKEHKDVAANTNSIGLLWIMTAQLNGMNQNFWCQ